MSKGKTQEKFIQNPMNDKYSDTMYKTGYLVFTDDAGFYYSGRVDNQIKYFGYRIELREIETGVLRLDFIDEAVAIYNESNVNLNSFIGMVVKSSHFIELKQFRTELSRVLPNYIIPSKIIFVETQFLRLENGKCNRREIAKLFV
ncbi:MULTISPECIES: hypothetical protein [unclassified Brenneria]|uniref:hypothetical protein n=1 Tax=unclassified Brenneria TaxID=2634434 RepID=UPI0020A6BD8D|nr:hypothetical protein [Brenneria sp. HEZEL_4_2_4]MEE3652794.1 hypothetical protein [Brenneria sp. HEZEL_4_2_4]